MCFARTAALQGGYEKQKVTASRDFLQQSLHHVQKSVESYAKTAFCSCVRHVRKSIKHRKNCGFCCMRSISVMRACGCPKTSSNVVLRAPKPASDHPKSSPERSNARKKRPTRAKKVQEALENQPRAKKRRPRAKNVPTWPQHERFRPA